MKFLSQFEQLRPVYLSGAVTDQKYTPTVYFNMSTKFEPTGVDSYDKTPLKMDRKNPKGKDRIPNQPFFG